jgi:hypothetical protein
MDDFLLDCCFNALYEGLKFRKSTPRYANWLRAMPHSADSRLPAIPHSAEFFQKISSPTPCYATQREIQFKIFWLTPRYAAQRGVDFALCSIAQSRDSPLCGIAQSRDSTLCHIARSRHKFAISWRIWNQILKYFRMIICDLGRLDWWKKPRVKNLVRLSL